MTDESNSNQLSLSQAEARELYDITIDALADDPDNHTMIRLSGKLLNIVDDEWLEDRDS